MRHRIIASFCIAMFGVSGAAHAQSSVDLYGSIDTGLLYQSKTADGHGSAFGTLNSGVWPTWWGLRGAEDIGGGTKVIFTLEGGFSVNTGAIGDSNGNLFGRQAYVGIDSPYGKLTTGLQISPFYYSIATADPRGDSLFFAGSMAPYVTAFGLNGAFESNAVVYTSPKIAGLKFSLEYAFGNVAGNVTAGSHMVASATYETGPITATAAYFAAKDAETGAATYHGQNVGIGYALGSVIFKVAFQKYKNMSTDAPLTNLNVYEAGVDWQITPALAASAAAYMTRDRNVSANRSMMYGGGLMYSLSKRTMIYGQIGYVNNEAEMNTSLAVDAAQSFAISNGGTVAVNVGIRHTF
jgi:predicted porin